MDRTNLTPITREAAESLIGVHHQIRRLPLADWYMIAGAGAIAASDDNDADFSWLFWHGDTEIVAVLGWKPEMPRQLPLPLF